MRGNWIRTNYLVLHRFPLFHRPSFLRALHNKMHLEDQGLFASTMAMCSLASARARDGALYSNRRSPSQLLHPPPEVFWTAAAESIPRNLAAARGIEYMRACAILSITAIQNGQIRDMHQYLGHYHTLSIMEGLHDEKSWPNDLSTVEVEIRRRLVCHCVHAIPMTSVKLMPKLVLVYVYT